jgi:mRNA-degrading endonuclease toxin of MazEF toxin-antitoxin module
VSLKDLIKESLLDDREFAFGQVWSVPDELISIPDADRANDRILHTARSVLIVSNNGSNTNPLIPIITVAPFSHRVDCKRLGDIELYAVRDGLKFDSIARMRLMQPVLKADLVRVLTNISSDGKNEILVGIEQYFGLITEE